ncbi:hypothetical protein B0A79_23865 [Flavobacterium piscis]|uniref:Recep_L_domain domain-containing protein n=1 Tax=Flavobacterium piscis TaxID=1114874 RepID=A0ABX2XLR1_9FLAO|nr:hypothetical protein [Flavobacterium piscis]OCB75552.1 hypothetical protein FLP_08785 [Flavobacterium piscis]OXE95929.1 hypothetical protein B0A79_23865 [Flavobacterium piscis]
MNLDSILQDDFMVKENEIDAIIRSYWIVIIGNYTINIENTVDVLGSVRFPDFASFLTELPLQFNLVSGDFDCSALVNLTSLKGVPIQVGGTFNCAYTNIRSLNYAPRSAQKLIFDNTIKSLSTNCNCDFNQVQIIWRNSNPLDSFPSTILEYAAFLPTILKYQTYFEVWNADYSFNEPGFENLIADIEEGLQ